MTNWRLRYCQFVPSYTSPTVEPLVDSSVVSPYSVPYCCQEYALVHTVVLRKVTLPNDHRTPFSWNCPADTYEVTMGSSTVPDWATYTEPCDMPVNAYGLDTTTAPLI